MSTSVNKPEWLHRKLSNMSSKRVYRKSFPREIRIETINTCNSACSFCSMNIHSELTKERIVKRMDEKVFKKLIDEMAEIEFDGILKLYCNNDPLIDRRLVEFVKYTKSKLPNLSRFQIDTNAKLLTYDLGVELLESGINELIIDDYAEDLNGGLNNRKEKIKDIYIKLSEKYSETHTLKYYPRLINEVLDSRAGLSPNNMFTPENSIHASCAYPFYSFYITSNGNVGFCHYDCLFDDPIGNVTNKSIKEVWTSEVFNKHRKELLSNTRTRKQCIDCNHHGHTDPSDILEDTHFIYNRAYRLLLSLGKGKNKVKSFISGNSSTKSADVIN